MAYKRNLLAIIIIFITLLAGLTHAEPNDVASQFLALQVEGDPYMVWFDKGKILYSQTAYKEAVEAFSKIGKDAPPDVLDESLYLTANSMLETGNYDDAISYVNTISNKSRIYPFVLYTKAMVNLKTGDEKIAIDNLEEVSKYIKSAQAAKVNQNGEQKGQKNETEHLAHRANLTLGFIYLEKEGYTDAIKYFSAVPKESPFHEKALFGLGWTYARMGRWVRSIVFWEELSSSYPDSHYSREVVPYIGYAYTKLNAYGKAIEQNGSALTYYRNMTAKLSDLKKEVQNISRNKSPNNSIDKLARAAGLLEDKELSAGLRLYAGLVSMEEYLGQASPGISYEIESLINTSKKKRADILDDIYEKALADLEHLQEQILESSIDTTLEMVQNLRLEGGGQISNDMIFVNHD